MTQTVTFRSFEIEISAETSVEEIRQVVEYAFQYEYEREDVSRETIKRRIEDVIRGLVWARDVVFELNTNPRENGDWLSEED